MSQEELLAKIESRIADFCEDEEDFCDVCSPWKALRAVVELHKPTNDPLSVTTFCLQCRDEQWPSEYPCATIQAIEKELA